MAGWLPGSKGERKLAMAVMVVLLLGTLAAVGAARKASVPEVPPPLVEVETPAALPLTGWTILVDPGHGGYDGGARARDSGIWEKHINLAVARQVQRALMARGAAVVMTRAEDIDLCTDERPAGKTMKREDMENRVRMAREARADMVLSIHMNEYRRRSQSGPQVFYREGCDGGRLLAGCLQETMIDYLQPRKKRSALAGDYFILQLEVPSALIECGFISNPEEEKLLLSADYQARLGEAIAEGAAMYAMLSGGGAGAADHSP